VSHLEQLLSLRLYHQGLAGMRRKKVVDDAAELLSFAIHSVDHLLPERLWNIWSKVFRNGASKPTLLVYQYLVTVKSCIDKFKKKVQNGSTLIEAVGIWNSAKGFGNCARR
jgi:hypothetical protein